MYIYREYRCQSLPTSLSLMLSLTLCARYGLSTVSAHKPTDACPCVAESTHSE